MQKYVLVCLLLFSCGSGIPEEPQEARILYEKALKAKNAGNTEGYLEILSKLDRGFSRSKYGRRAALILATPPYQEGLAENQAGAFEDFRKKVQGFGVRETIRQIYEAEGKYYSQTRKGVFGEDLPKRFVAAGPTPPQVPKGRPVFPPLPAFDAPGWRKISFSHSGPMRFQYTVLSKGEGPSAKLIIRALGDIDGDGVYSVYELHAKADASGQVIPQGDILVREEGE